MPSVAPARRAAPRPGLKRELLFGLALLATAALSIAVLATLLAQLFRPDFAVIALVVLIVADVTVLFLFGRYLVERLVLTPLGALTRGADEVASGNLVHRAPVAETREFAHLAERFNHMTERLLDAQRQLVRAEKLASVGRLAAGVAHEVGNPLSAIGTYLEVLKKRGGDSDLVRSMELEAGRIDRIVRGLLDYAGRRHRDQADHVDVSAVLHGVVELLTHQGVLKGLTLHRALPDKAVSVKGDAHSLEQVIVNLLLNAADAAPGGTVSIGAQEMEYHADMVTDRRRDDALAPPPGYRISGRRPWRPELAESTPGVVLWVADSGPGVPVEDREKVFDPFFTTKPPGCGTGLGLAIVGRTVDEMGGVVWVDDAREGGAAFKVFLPKHVSVVGEGVRSVSAEELPADSATAIGHVEIPVVAAPAPSTPSRKAVAG